MSEVTPGNGVTSDTIKNPIEILIGNFHDIAKLKVWRSMLFFLYETDVEITKIIISEPFPEIPVVILINSSFVSVLAYEVTLRHLRIFFARAVHPGSNPTFFCQVHRPGVYFIILRHIFKSLVTWVVGC